LPPVTLSHSTTTVPLNFLGSAGRRTTIRLSYGADTPLPRFVAVPEKKYSFSV
jgi:hypothetical protein